MSFDPETQRIPTAVKGLQIRLMVYEKEDGSGNAYEANYDFHILDADNKSMSNRTGDLIPQLTSTQKTALTNFLDAMLTKAKGTIT